jgi:TctA family transporter
MNYLYTLASTHSSDTAGAAAGLGLGLFMLLFWLIMMAFAVTSWVLWLISLIHVLQHDDIKDRTMWILIILLGGGVGGIIYFFAAKRPYDRGGMRDLTTGSVAVPTKKS